MQFLQGMHKRSCSLEESKAGIEPSQLQQHATATCILKHELCVIEESCEEQPCSAFEKYRHGQTKYGTSTHWGTSWIPKNVVRGIWRDLNPASSPLCKFVDL